jgi:site-specific recombinase XerC
VQLRPGDFDADIGALRVRGKGRRERCVFVVDKRLLHMMAKLAARLGAVGLLAPDAVYWSTQSTKAE